jgi:hypothetical protein
MKITIDFPASDLERICEMTGIRKKSPAIRKVLEDALRLRERADIANKFVSGEWSAELEGFESAKARDRMSAQSLQALWHD